MQCPQCQQENPVEDNFCLNCGSKLAKICPQCQHMLPPEANFCMICGQSLTIASQPLPTVDHSTSAKVSPPEPPIPDAERRQLTVTFCDLAGVTKISGHRGAGMKKMNKISFSSMLLVLAVMLIPSSMMFAAERQLKIAMVQWTGDTRACIGFRDGLKELGYAVEYTILNADQDKTKLGYLLRKMLQPGLKAFDYVYTYGTTVTKATKQVVNNQVPQIFAIVLDPVGAGIVQSMESSGANLTGASNGISLALQLDTALKIVTFKTLGFLFNSREKNSVLAREQLRALAANRGIELMDLRSPPAMDSLKKNLQKLKDKSIVVDAVYMPSDSFMRTKAELIGAELRAARIKSFGATREYVEGGVLMGLVPDYYKLGKAAAKVVDIHQKGEKLRNIPVATDKEPTLLVNRATARLLNVTIPAALLAKAIFVE